MKQTTKRHLTQGLAAVLAVTTLGTATPVFAAEITTPTSINYVSRAVTDYDQLTDIFVNTYGRDNISTVVLDAVGGNEVVQQRGVVSITTKALKKLLKEKADDIILALRKVPGIGNAVGNFLEKNLGGLIDFLDKVEGGAEAAIVRFFVSVGMKESTAEIWADVIMTVVGLFL